MARKIKIKCDGSDYLTLEQITPFQDDLKTRTDADIAAVQKSIDTYGFSFPFFIWKNGKTNWCLDGHGRLNAITKMADGDYEVPPLPVVYIKASSRDEAKQKLLRMNSTYGKISEAGLMEFTEGIEVAWEELSLPSGQLMFAPLDDEEPEEDDDEQYTRNIETPVYTPTGEKPELSELVDMTKVNELIQQIDKSKLPDAEKEFLRVAAGRHAVFNYSKVAEYYAHAEKPAKRLFENSVLVIIDFNKAIEDGFVKLTEAIENQLREDIQDGDEE